MIYRKIAFLAIANLLGMNYAVYPMETVKNMSMNVLKETGNGAGILGVSIAAAITYGITKNMVTANVCPEFFSQGILKKKTEQFHKDSWLKSSSSIKLAFGWGVGVSWRMGALLGIPIAAASRFGSWPQLCMRDLVKPAGIAITGMYALSMINWLYGYYKATKMNNDEIKIWLSDRDSLDVSKHKQKQFIASYHAHGGDFIGERVAVLGLIAYVVIERYRRS